MQRRRFILRRLTVRLTEKELQLLTSLASDQLFRREFIDSRLPGSKSNPVELSLGKQLVKHLELLSDRATRISPVRGNGVAIARKSRTTTARRIPDAL